LAFFARRFSLRVLPATFFVLLPPLSLFAIGVLQTGDRSGSRGSSIAYLNEPRSTRPLTTLPTCADRPRSAPEMSPVSDENGHAGITRKHHSEG
jgi:hypothetical protein